MVRRGDNDDSDDEDSVSEQVEANFQRGNVMSKAIVAIPSSQFEFSEYNGEESDEEPLRQSSHVQKNDATIDEETETLLHMNDETSKKDSIH